MIKNNYAPIRREANPTLRFPRRRECIVMEKGSRNSKKRNRRTGEKALDLPARSRFGEGRAQPLNHETQGPQVHEKIDFLIGTTMISNLKRGHSKALPACRKAGSPAICSVFPFLRSITTQSLRGEGLLRLTGTSWIDPESALISARI